MSHKTRAYIVNADGLKGFLVKLGKVVQIIKAAEKSGEIDEVLMW